MNGLRRACFLLAVLAGAPVWSDVTPDFGLSIRNVTGVESADGFAQRDRVSLWFLAQGPRTKFEVSGVYDLTIQGPTVTHLADVERLLLTTTVPGDGQPLSRFGFSLGRQIVTDHTGLVVNQALDGLGLTVGYPFATVSAAVGTTFLPNKGSGPVLLSRGDAADFTNTSVLLGSPRIVGLVELVFPNVFRQRVTLSFAMQEDFRGILSGGPLASQFANRAAIIEEGTTAQDPSLGGLVDTQYTSLGLRGNLVGGLFYNAFATLNTGRTLSYLAQAEGEEASGVYMYEPIYAVLGGAGVTYFAEQLLGSVAGLRFVLSTGDAWDERTGFVESSTTATPNLYVPVTAVPISPVLRATLGNIAFTEASYTLRPFTGIGIAPLENMQIGLTGLLFFRPAVGPVSVPVSADAAAVSPYLGAEIDLRVGYRPLSDIGVDLTAGLFLPNSGDSGVFATESLRAPRWRIEATLSLSL
jgi:hypothetical protein